jgi:hypothetical protein
MTTNKPIKSFKAGAVKASIFENASQYKGAHITTHRVVIDKTFKDSAGNWKSTNSFFANTELSKAILVLQKSYEYLMLKEQTDDLQGEEYR